MTAVAALPYLYFALLEYGSCLYIFQESTITLFVMFLDLADHTEFCCQCMETFLISGLCELIIHIGPLVVFAVCCCRKVCCGIATPF